MADAFTWDPSQLEARLKTFDAKVERAIAGAVTMHASRAQSYARQNAPWTDRTSNARNGLFAKAEKRGRSYRITIGHSVPYGVWLEVRFSGRYAIIRPTIDHEGPAVMRTITGLLNRM